LLKIVLKLSNELGCTMIVHQQIRVRQILIYKIRIRRKQISAGCITSLLVSLEAYLI